MVKVSPRVSLKTAGFITFSRTASGGSFVSYSNKCFNLFGLRSPSLTCCYALVSGGSNAQDPNEIHSSFACF